MLQALKDWGRGDLIKRGSGHTSPCPAGTFLLPPWLGIGLTSYFIQGYKGLRSFSFLKLSKKKNQHGEKKKDSESFSANLQRWPLSRNSATHYTLLKEALGEQDRWIGGPQGSTASRVSTAVSSFLTLSGGLCHDQDSGCFSSKSSNVQFATSPSVWVRDTSTERVAAADASACLCHFGVSPQQPTCIES